MYPHEQLLVKNYADRPFALIGVNSDANRDQIKKIIKEKELTWRSFWNGGSTDGPISNAWNVTGWPTIYLIDHEGVIREKNLRGTSLDKAIEELVQKAEAARGR